MMDRVCPAFTNGHVRTLETSRAKSELRLLTAYFRRKWSQKFQLKEKINEMSCNDLEEKRKGEWPWGKGRDFGSPSTRSE